MMPRNRLTAGVWLAVTFLLLSSQASAVAVRVSGDRVFVPLVINGVAVEALLDSGAEMTLVDVKLADRLGLTLEGSEMAKGTGGQELVRFASEVDLTSARVRLEDRTVVVLDLGDVSRRVVGEPISAVLGRELFDAGRFLLDIEGGCLERVESDGEPVGEVVKLTDHKGIKQMPISIEGVAVGADFDLGNGSEMLIGRGLAEAHGWLSAERLAGAREGGGLGGAVERDLIRLETVSVNDVVFRDVIAAVDATGNASDANVGVSLLRRFLLTIDFPSNRLWLEPRGRGRDGC